MADIDVTFINARDNTELDAELNDSLKSEQVIQALINEQFIFPLSDTTRCYMLTIIGRNSIAKGQTLASAGVIMHDKIRVFVAQQSEETNPPYNLPTSDDNPASNINGLLDSERVDITQSSITYNYYNTYQIANLRSIFLDPSANITNRLRVFLCHSSGDKPAVRNLYQRLKAFHVDPWLDEENLLPGHDWEYEIRKAVRASDVVIICLSHSSISKTGFIQKEIKFALDVADEQPEGTIFLIPLKLEECEMPERLRHWHWVNYFEENGFNRLKMALERRRASL